MMKFNLVAVGGTFDHLHLGHQKLLEAGKKSGEKIIVGLCRQSMLKHKTYPQSLESFRQRKNGLVKLGFQNIIPLSDIYGPAATDPNIKAVICSPLTRANAVKINRKRKLNNLNHLSIIEIPLVMAADSKRLASARIRQGLINREGFYFPALFAKNLSLPQSLRPALQQPLSSIVKQVVPARHGLIAVGDIAAISCLQKKIVPDLAVVDLKTRRQPVFSGLNALGLRPGLKAVNPAGTINAGAVKQILICLDKNLPSLLINGEEDLLTLPAILLAPLKTVIYYGQPGEGLVKITVTETAKTKTLKLLRQFT